MILVLGKSALSVPDTRFSRVSGSTLVLIQLQAVIKADVFMVMFIELMHYMLVFMLKVVVTL